MYVWVGIRWFLKNVGADVALFTFYYFRIQEIHGLVRYFMGEFNRWFNAVEVLSEGGKGTCISFSDEKNVVGEPYPVNYVVGPFRSVFKCVFKPGHIHVRKIRCRPCAHYCEIVVVKCEIVQLKAIFKIEVLIKGLFSGGK